MNGRFVFSRFHQRARSLMKFVFSVLAGFVLFCILYTIVHFITPACHVYSVNDGESFLHLHKNNNSQYGTISFWDDKDVIFQAKFFGGSEPYNIFVKKRDSTVVIMDYYGFRADGTDTFKDDITILNTSPDYHINVVKYDDRNYFLYKTPEYFPTFEYDYCLGVSGYLTETLIYPKTQTVKPLHFLRKWHALNMAKSSNSVSSPL